MIYKSDYIFKKSEVRLKFFIYENNISILKFRLLHYFKIFMKFILRLPKNNSLNFFGFKNLQLKIHLIRMINALLNAIQDFIHAEKLKS